MFRFLILSWLCLAVVFVHAQEQYFINSLGDTVQTGLPIPAIGKAIHPDSVSKPNVVQVGIPKVVPTNTNIHVAGIPKVVEAKSYAPNLDSITAVLINSTGDTLQTGVPIQQRVK
jgi:hypothetical protein